MGALFVAALVLPLACGSPATAPASSDTVRAEIQALYDRRAAALAKGDARELEATYDTSRPALRRSNNGHLEAARRGFVEGVSRVTAIEPYGDHYVRVYVHRDTELIFGIASASHAVREYARRVDGRWVLSDPLDDELGASRERSGDGVGVSHFAVDDDLAPLIHDAARRARTEVARFAPRGFVAETRLRLYPTLTALGPGADIDVISFTRRGETILLPIALGIDRGTGLSDITQFLVRHSIAARLRAEIQPGIEARLSRDQWLDKGWASFAAGAAQRPDFFKAACGGVAPLSLKDVSAGDSITPYSRDYPTYYAYQAAMVEYLYERFGPRAYWDLIDAFRADADSRVTFPKVLKTTPDAFYATIAWRGHDEPDGAAHRARVRGARDLGAVLVDDDVAPARRQREPLLGASRNARRGPEEALRGAPG